MVGKTVYLVVSVDKGPNDAERVAYVVGVYATKASAASALRRHEDMRKPGVSGFSYVDVQEVRP